MSSRQASIEALLDKAGNQIRDLEGKYKKSLNAQSIEPALRVEIKNTCENLRSVLDYLAADIRERYCPKASPKDHFYFPILPDRKTFDSRMNQWFPGINKAIPSIITVLEAVQPYQPGYEWLGQFNRVNNENKHGDLVEQTRVEAPEIKVTGHGGQVSWNSGVTFGRGVSVMGVPIDPRTQLPIPDPSIKVERTIWVDFLFADIGVSALGLLKQALSGIASIVEDIWKLL